MTDVKISQLPPATLPLTGTEIVPLVQSSTTVQTTVNSISVNTATSVLSFGAIGDGVNDDTAAIQAAIDASSSVFFPTPAAFYKITSPIYLSSGKSIFGPSGTLVRIVKTTNTLGSGSNTYGAQTDSYAKDAVLIVRHADNAYATYVNVQNLDFSSTVNCDYVIYAPRMYVGGFSNVNIGVTGGLYGFVTHDTFMFTMDSIQIAGNNSNVVGSVGFWWDDQLDGSSGTSVSFNRCWVRDGLETAYKFRGLIYSSLVACGADKYVNRALDVELCDLSLNGFGFENRTSLGVAPFKLRYSRVEINSAVGFSTNIAATDYLIDAQGGAYNINGLRHTVTGAGTGFGRAYRVADNCVLNVSGMAIGSIADLTPNVDATSTFNQKDQNYTIKTSNNTINPYGGQFVVSDSTGLSLGYLQQVFSNSVRLHSTGSIYLGVSDALTYLASNTAFRPYVSDGVLNLGSGGNRFNTLYASNGTINTSDGREKQQVHSLSAAEKAVAKRLKSLVKSFKFNDAVELKGDAARIHVGVIAQDVVDAFAAEGLDATRYGLLCYDEWDAQPEQVDADGTVLAPAQKAENRYGVRYDELLAFIIAAI